MSKLFIAAANVSAIYKCTATNEAGKDEHIVAFLVTRKFRRKLFTGNFHYS